MTDDLLQAVRDLPRVSRYLHVPAQSGCDEVLKRMKRMYTVASYEEMLARVRETIPGVAVSSDFIVGFCGETEASFERTVGLVERSRFKNSFIFKYSPRQGTKADQLFADDVPEDVKKRRNNELLAIQTAISLEDNRRWIGRDVEVLVEGPSRSSVRREGWDGVDQLTGRTACDRIAVFDGPERLIGRLVRVAVEDASAVTLFGRVETSRAHRDPGVRDEVDGRPAGGPRGRLDAAVGDRPRPCSRPLRAGSGVSRRPWSPAGRAPTPRRDHRLGGAARVPVPGGAAGLAAALQRPLPARGRSSTRSRRSAR